MKAPQLAKIASFLALTALSAIAPFAARAAQTPAGQWIEGRGYDDTRLPELRHPNRYDLDRASATHPILLGRTCGHVIAVNSRALELAGITANTPDPAGPPTTISTSASGNSTRLWKRRASGASPSRDSPPGSADWNGIRWNRSSGSIWEPCPSRCTFTPPTKRG